MNGAEMDERSIRVEKAKRTAGYAKTPGKCNYLLLIVLPNKGLVYLRIVLK